MKVTLVCTTANAVELLIFTKSTRLRLHAGLLDEIKAWPIERKLQELEYISKTIPSSWEFVDYTFAVEGVSRAYTHQQVRSRHGSYAQQTMRLLDMSDFGYIFTERNAAEPRAVARIERCLDEIKSCYRDLIAMGQAEEDARGVLPTNISTNIVCKFNLRTFVELFRSRSGGRTQDEYRQVINAMADAVLNVHPWAAAFLFPRGRSAFDEIEEFARHRVTDGNARRDLLKIVDFMRKEWQ